MAWQDEIVEVLGANERSSAFDPMEWAKVEVEIGCNLPEGFKLLIDRLGAGCIGDFLWLPAPSHANINLDATELVKKGVYCYSYLQERHPIYFPRPSPPKEGSAVVFAVTDNGDYLSFILGPGDPDHWPVALCHAGADYEEFLADGVEEFFCALVGNRLQCDGFPSDFLDQEMTFVTVKT